MSADASIWVLGMGREVVLIKIFSADLWMSPNNFCTDFLNSSSDYGRRNAFIHKPGAACHYMILITKCSTLF